MHGIEFVDHDGERHSWRSWAEFAEHWWTAWSAGQPRAEDQRSPAWDHLYEITAHGRPEWLHALQALVDAAPDDDGLALVGAGPLEDLLSHDRGDDRRHVEFADELERRARQQPRWRAAVAGLWLGDDVPLEVRRRLMRCGAT